MLHNTFVVTFISFLVTPNLFCNLYILSFYTIVCCNLYIFFVTPLWTEFSLIQKKRSHGDQILNAFSVFLAFQKRYLNYVVFGKNCRFGRIMILLKGYVQAPRKGLDFAALHRLMVTSPYEWNILEWGVKKYTNSC